MSGTDSGVLIVRITKLLRLIDRRGGVTVDEICSELGVCRRTAHRYITRLEEAGIPLVVAHSTGPGDRTRRWRRFEPKEVVEKWHAR